MAQNGQVVIRRPLLDATGHDSALVRSTPTPGLPRRVRPRRHPSPMSGDDAGVIGITQRELLMEMRDDIRALRSVVDAVARDRALSTRLVCCQVSARASSHSSARWAGRSWAWWRSRYQMLYWRARQDSNLRPSAPEADALSTELQARDPNVSCEVGWPFATRRTTFGPE